MKIHFKLKYLLDRKGRLCITFGLGGSTGHRFDQPDSFLYTLALAVIRDGLSSATRVPD